ncbi:MAG: hypothetical protein IT426_15040 [Pirellulales bacterium]|nr:hypothetical protein [Pirellulales bacterium]
MKALLFTGLLLGLLVANSARAGEGNSAPYAGDFSARTYECGAPCDDCSDDFCDEPCGRPCGRGACGDRTACGPLTLIFSIFNCNTWRGPSCGERYWGDFYSDPPDCCDPCDRGGNYAGRSYYDSDWGSVRGYGSSGGGCSNCNKNRAYDSQPIPQESRVVYPSTRVSRQPTPAKQPSKAVRTR